MAETNLSHEEIWDDSELLKSWNEAYEEYEKYHSLAAKGEKVKLADAGLTNGDTHPTAAPTDVDDDEVEVASSVDNSLEASLEHDAAGAESAAPAATSHAFAAPAIPQALMGTVQSEDVKNLMMSWYYAGYYTGLYEGKQLGYARAQQQKPLS